MKTYKSLYIVFFIGGLLILIIGIFLQIFQVTSGGTGYTLEGGSFQGSLNGTSAIIMGSIILFLSGVFFMVYKNERKRYEDLDEES